MRLYLGNITTEINCDDIINQCQRHDVAPSHGHMDLSIDNEYYDESIKQNNTLQQAGYDHNTVEYRHYQSGIHFDTNIQDVFGKFVNATPLMCWISELRPGKCTPWHWDINPWENEHKKLGTLVRHFCFLSKPAAGHLFVVDKDAYYYEDQGAVYQYPDIHSWHAGTNIGVGSKFLLTFTGYQ